VKLKITKTANSAIEASHKLCSSCAGSGWYDSWDTKKNRPVPCDSCNNTGWDSVEDQRSLPSRS